jgi:ribosomal protein S25
MPLSERIGKWIRLIHRLEDQRRVGGRVARRVLRELAEVAGVGDDG